MKLHSYWRSTTSYRAQIALNLKGIVFETAPVNLFAGDHNAPDYVALNPSRSVSTLVLDDGDVLTQSMAILDWLEETQPDPALLPADATERAKVRGAALAIACDIHPVNNLLVLGKLKSMGHSQDDTIAWMNESMARRFTAFNDFISPGTPFWFGDALGLADLSLVPQLYHAHRWGCDLTDFPRLAEIEARCLSLPAFDAARSERQLDAT